MRTESTGVFVNSSGFSLFSSSSVLSTLSYLRVDRVGYGDNDKGNGDSSPGFEDCVRIWKQSEGNLRAEFQKW